MAETAAQGTTRPARTRRTTPAASKPQTAAKAAPKAAPKAEAAPEVTRTEVTRIKVELEHVGTTKSFEKFAAPESMKGVVVGNLYAPLGTQRVGVVVIGPDDNGDE